MNYQLPYKIGRKILNCKPALPHNYSFKQAHFWITYPTGVPGGLVTSSSCKQQGKQHSEHLKGRFKCITSWLLLSKILISKDLAGPQHCRLQQSLSINNKILIMSQKTEAAIRAATLLKKRLWHRCFPVNFAKLLKTPFLQNTSGQLLLKKENPSKQLLEVWRMFKVINKDTRTTLLTTFKCLYCYLWTYFTRFSSLSIDSEQVNVCWDWIRP